jgi:hypothetical protein
VEKAERRSVVIGQLSLVNCKWQMTTTKNDALMNVLTINAGEKE